MRMIRMLVPGMCLMWTFALVGCAPSAEEMAAMMKQPQRPVELDRLEAFVGTWTSDVTVKVSGADETKKSSGTNTTKWSTDKWILVENWEHDMGEHDTMKGVNLMWWDANSKKYRVFSTDNYGGSGTGVMTYDHETDTWKMKWKSRDREGHKSVGKGTMRVVNPSTMEWNFGEYDGTGLFKMVEVSGTSKRQ